MCGAPVRCHALILLEHHPAPETGEGGKTLDLVRVGDVLTVTERLTDIVEKAGRTGPLVFVTTDSTYHNQLGTLVGRYRQTIIFR